MRRSIAILCCSIFLTLSILACSKGSPANNSGIQASPSIATTIFPLYVITQQITGDKMHIELIVLPGESPHTFNPTPKTKEVINNSSKIFAIGHLLDNWVLELVDDKSKIIVVDKNISLRKFGTDDHYGHNLNDQAGYEIEKHTPGQYDPHYWLDPRNAKIIANTITEELVLLDPTNRDYYENKLQSFEDEIDILYTEQLALMKSIRHIPFMTMHDAWFYYAEAFDLNLMGTFNPSGSENPTPKYLQSLQELIQQNDIKAIFNEPQLPVSGLLPFIADNKLSLGIIDPLSGMHGIERYSHLIRYNSKELISTLKSSEVN